MHRVLAPVCLPKHSAHVPSVWKSQRRTDSKLAQCQRPPLESVRCLRPSQGSITTTAHTRSRLSVSAPHARRQSMSLCGNGSHPRPHAKSLHRCAQSPAVSAPPREPAGRAAERGVALPKPPAEKPRTEQLHRGKPVYYSAAVCPTRVRRKFATRVPPPLVRRHTCGLKLARSRMAAARRI